MMARKQRSGDTNHSAKKKASKCIQTFTMFLLAQYKVQPTLDKYKRTQKKASMDKDLVYHIPMKAIQMPSLT